MMFLLEFEQETDGRWICEVRGTSALAYGAQPGNAAALALAAAFAMRPDGTTAEEIDQLDDAADAAAARVALNTQEEPTT